MAIFRANTSRRRELRKTIPRQRAGLRQLVTRTQVLWAALFIVVYVAVASWITLETRFEPDYRPGQLVYRPQVARVAFTTEDVKATTQAREFARAQVPAIYVPNTPFLEETRVALRSLPAVATAAPSLDKVAEDIRTKFNLTQETLEALRQYQAGEEVSPEWLTAVDHFMQALAKRPIIVTERYQVEKSNLTRLVRLAPDKQNATPASEVKPGEEPDTVSEDALINLADDQLRKAVVEMASPFPDSLQPLIVNYFLASKQPTYQFDSQATEAARAAAGTAVEPVLIQFEPQHVIAPAGTVLDEGTYNLILREQQTYRAQLGGLHKLARWLGPIALIWLVALVMAAAAWALRPRVGQNPMRGLALTALLLLTLGLASLLQLWIPAMATTAMVAPVILAAMALSIAYDPRFSSTILALHAMVIGIALDVTLGIYLVTIIGTVVAAAQVRQIRERGTPIRAGFYTAIVVFIGVFGAALAERQLVTGIYRATAIEAGLASVLTLFVGFLILGLLSYIERVFKVTTAMKLLELCDVNQPLLRRLAQSAPGTYNHSLMVGTLAENASETIGANGLLARVGAYYHDIGKINKPQYFVENRVGSVNLHEKLSPAMSLLIIVGHVKDGIEMAREYGLPPVLHHFIESHHGTTLVEYFYHEAKKQKPESEQPEEIEYRYPGPKPHTKEAAILMLCDAVESASRAMAEPTTSRIEQLVHKIASKRLMDGQFDECDITLAELHQVEQSLTKSLASIYHGRIAYPSAPQPRRPSDAGRAVAS